MSFQITAKNDRKKARLFKVKVIYVISVSTYRFSKYMGYDS